VPPQRPAVVHPREDQGAPVRGELQRACAEGVEGGDLPQAGAVRLAVNCLLMEAI
jgi:hypothetical protein